MLRIITLLLLVTSACTLSPYSGQTVESNTVVLYGLTRQPGVRVRIDVLSWQTNTFYETGAGMSETTPVFPAGAICPNSPALYDYRAVTHRLSWHVFWRKVTDNHWEAKLRATAETGVGEERLRFASGPGAADCMRQRGFNGTCDFVQIANACGYNLDAGIVVNTSPQPWLDEN